MSLILNDKMVGKLIKTFIEGFLASLILQINEVGATGNIDVWKTIFIGAIAMGLSAILNFIQITYKGVD